MTFQGKFLCTENMSSGKNILLAVFAIATFITVVANNLEDATAISSIAYTYKNGTEDATCEAVKRYFNTLNVTTSRLGHPNSNIGPICDGRCCGSHAEQDLFKKSTSNFLRLLNHHTESLRGTLETTGKTFRNYVLELSHQSENKTLNLLSQVYRQMSPHSHQLITELYQNIRSVLDANSGDTSAVQDAVKRFFVKLFPLAYHNVIHGEADNSFGDFHEDYKSCLIHTFDDHQPFGDIPNILAKSLTRSVNSAAIFLNSISAAVKIFANTENIHEINLTPKCSKHLLKLSYCSQCKGISKPRAKSCYGYCINVMRGCLAQHLGVLDIPWSKVAEALEQFYYTSIRPDTGIEETIKTLDVKLSEAIMKAMENGPDLEKKVKKSCGVLKLLSTHRNREHWREIDKTPTQQFINSKWVPSPNTEMLHFLVTINKSKDFYSNIINRVCEDEEFKRDNQNCWTGDRVGEYTQTIMTQNEDAQKYNPEVPLIPHTYTRAHNLSELVDQLLKLRILISNAILHHENYYSSLERDFQGDMARTEGSAFSDDEENFDSYQNSGDGSGIDIDREDVSYTTGRDGIQILNSSGASPNSFKISSTIIMVYLTTYTTMAFT